MIDAAQLDRSPANEAEQSATTAADDPRPLQLEGSVRLDVRPGEYEEYLRLREQTSRALDDDDLLTDRDPVVAGQPFDAFIEEIESAIDPIASHGDPLHPASQASTVSTPSADERLDSIALSQLTSADSHGTPRRASRHAARLAGLVAMALSIAAACVVVVLDAPRSSDRGTAREVAGGSATVFGGLRADADAVEASFAGLLRQAAHQQRELAVRRQTRARAARRKAASRRAAGRRRGQVSKDRHSATAPAATKPVSPAVSATSSGSAPTTATTNTTATTPAARPRGASPATARKPAFGEGGLLGAGHSTDSG